MSADAMPPVGALSFSRWAGRFAALLVVALALPFNAGCGGLHVQLRPLGTEPGQALPVRLWPLLHTEPQPSYPADLLERGLDPRPGHFTVAWPFVQWRGGRDYLGRHFSSFGIHPLYARESKPAQPEGDSRVVATNFLWPIFSWRHEIEPGLRERWKFIVMPLVLRQVRREERGDGTYVLRKRFFVFPLWWGGSTTSTTLDDDGNVLPPGRRSNTTFFPFVWLARGESTYLPQFNPKGREYTWIWPFYGGWEYGPPGNERAYHFLLWPLFVWSHSTDDPSQHAFNLVWPFFRVQWGGEKEKVRELKLWPLFGYMRRGAHWRLYLIWPLFIWREASTDEEVDKQRLIFPFYLYSAYKEAVYRLFFPFTGTYRDEDERVLFVFWPFFARWVHEGEHFKETQILWHIFRWRNGTGDEANTYHQLFPLYSYRNEAGRERWYSPLLLWHGSREQRFDPELNMDYRWTARYSFPLFFNKTRIYDDGRRAWSRFVFPFGLWQKAPDGSTRSRSPWIFWQENLEGMNRNWTPLWAFSDKEKTVLAPTKHAARARRLGILEEILPKDDPPGEGETAAVEDVVEAEPRAEQSVTRRSYLGYFYRSEFGPGVARRHLNLLLFSYDRVGSQRAVSLLGGWLPLVWGRESPAP